MIDLIIPLYNTKSELFERCLYSIASQTFLKFIKVTVVDDCSSKDYSDIISRLKHKVNINYIKLDKNVGVGKARQYGIDNTNGEYIIFLDSDDTFHNVYSVEKLYRKLVSKNDIDLVVSGYLEEGNDFNFHYVEYNVTWVFAKIYKRRILSENNISFSELRYNEDACFNSKVFSCCKNIEFIDEPMVVWCNNNESLTRKGTIEGDLESALCFIESYKELFLWKQENKDKIKNNEFSDRQSIDGIILMYWYYIKYIQKYGYDFANKAFIRIKSYFDLVGFNGEDLVNSEVFRKQYFAITFNQVAITKNIIPTMTIYDFVWKLSQKEVE